MNKTNLKNFLWIGGIAVFTVALVALFIVFRPKTINPDVTDIVVADNSPVLLEPVIEEVDSSTVTLDDTLNPEVVEEIEMTEEDVPEPYRYHDDKVTPGYHIEVSKDGKAEEVKNEDVPSATDTKQFVTLNISCHGILDVSTEDLKNAIPNEGYLLTSCQVEVKSGDTVKDVLVRVLQSKGIPATYGDSPFGTYFSMIDNLSDSKIGHTAGWCYYVNGSMPSVSSSAVQVNNGDTISWEYDDDWNLTLF